MGKPLDECRVGQVVVSRKGKDSGRVYVVVGFLGENRLALADAEKFTAARPKPKNLKHVKPTSRVIPEVALWLEVGKDIDRGELCRLLESACEQESERRGRAANGE